mgnify:CR=1 FL=1
MDDTVLVTFYYNKDANVDLEIPISISANDLVLALNQAYHLGIQTENIRNCYMIAENPIVLLKGNKTLEELGIRNGSVIYYQGE